MDTPVLVSVMGVLTIVAVYFWWARKAPKATEPTVPVEAQQAP